jgi:hypothetical protein
MRLVLHACEAPALFGYKVYCRLRARAFQSDATTGLAPPLAAAPAAAAAAKTGKHLNSDTVHFHPAPAPPPNPFNSRPTDTAFVPANLLMAFKSSAKVQPSASAGCRARAVLHWSTMPRTSAEILSGSSRWQAESLGDFVPLNEARDDWSSCACVRGVRL